MTNRRRYLVALALAVLVVASCGGASLSGEYADDSGMFTYNFKPGGKVEITTNVLGTSQTVEMHYELEEGKVKVGTAGGPQQVITIDKEGCLDMGGIVGKLCKKKK